jgi:uncharacterized protein
VSLPRLSDRDRLAVRQQLGREPRDVLGVAHRCTCSNPDVIATAPRLSDGTPFPTLYYLTCPRAASQIGTLEASGLMAVMTERLQHDGDVARAYRLAHEAYLRDRDGYEHVAEIDGISGGGMPSRVKCLHVLVAHALAAGAGVNPLGDEALAMLPDWAAEGPCVEPPAQPDQP